MKFEKVDGAEMRMGALGALALSCALASAILTGCAPSAEETWQSEYEALDPAALDAQWQEVVDCLADRGFPGATTIWGGGVTLPQIAAAQADAAHTATTECIDESGLGAAAEPPNSSAIEKLYHLDVAAYECLIDAGLSPTEPPSLQVYRDEYGSEDAWTAWGSVGSQVSAGQAQQVGKECPDPHWFESSLR